MTDRNDIALLAHLMRRAGFGATRSELEELAETGYENVVEQLLHPERQPDLDKHEFYRYFPQAENSWTYLHVQMDWLYSMRNGKRPLQEKMTLFWHQVFATASSKVERSYAMAAQVRLFQRAGLGNYKQLLVELAKDPAMIFWLDNQDNNKRALNENWGRELLELFSMGVGNYTEGDVYEGSRAFTGWSFRSVESSWRWGQFDWTFDYRAEDHDARLKSFLGHYGKLNGEDVIEVVVQQPACARFICSSPLQLLRGRRAAGATVDSRASARPGRGRSPGHHPSQVSLRDEAGPAHPVQLRLLQRGHVPACQEPGRGPGRYPEAHRRP